MLRAEQMRSLPHFFADIPDPRRSQGRRHRLATVLAIAAGATLCGMRGYRAMSDWANNLGQKARERFGYRREKRRYVVPSQYVIRDALLTQRTLADYQVRQRQAHYHFTVKGNQAGLFEDIQFYFQHRKQPDFVDYAPPDHGRIETRKIWTTNDKKRVRLRLSELNKFTVRSDQGATHIRHHRFQHRDTSGARQENHP